MTNTFLVLLGLLERTADSFIIWSTIVLQKVIIRVNLGMSCPSWQWHRTGYSWSPVLTM